MPSCRKRTEPPVEPFGPWVDDGDVDAMKLMMGASRSIVDAYWPWKPNEILAQRLTAEDLKGFVLLNHAVAYLEDRPTYEKEIRPQLYGYIVVD
jgi:hypothetical protein